MTLAGARIAVTGATGFIGRYIVDVLLARGAHVIGVVRNPAKVPELAQKGVELRQADLSQRDRLPPGVEVFQISGPLFFGAANRLDNLLSSYLDFRVRWQKCGFCTDDCTVPAAVRFSDPRGS